MPFVPFRLVKYAEPIRPRLEASVRLVIPDGSRDRPREKSRRGRLFCFPKTSHHSQDLVNPSRNETLPAGPEEERGEGVLLDTKDAPSRLLLWDGWLWTLLLFPSLPEFKIAAAEGMSRGRIAFPNQSFNFLGTHCQVLNFRPISTSFSSPLLHPWGGEETEVVVLTDVRPDSYVRENPTHFKITPPFFEESFFLKKRFLSDLIDLFPVFFCMFVRGSLHHN